MQTDTKYASIFTRWESMKTKEIIVFKRYDNNPPNTDQPMIEIIRLQNDQGEDVNNEIIASDPSPRVIQQMDKAIIGHFEVRLVEGLLKLTHKGSGETKLYKKEK